MSERFQSDASLLGKRSAITDPMYSLPVEFIDQHLDAVLRASGSALRHYSLSGVIRDMRLAMDTAMIHARRLGDAPESLRSREPNY